jgi:hypothetical protein
MDEREHGSGCARSPSGRLVKIRTRPLCTRGVNSHTCTSQLVQRPRTGCGKTRARQGSNKPRVKRSAHSCACAQRSGRQAARQPAVRPAAPPFRRTPPEGAVGASLGEGSGGRLRLPHAQQCPLWWAHHAHGHGDGRACVRVRALQRTAVSVLTHAHPWCAPLWWCTAVSSCCVHRGVHTHAGTELRTWRCGGLVPLASSGAAEALSGPQTVSDLRLSTGYDPPVLKPTQPPSAGLQPALRMQPPRAEPLRAAQLGLSRPSCKSPVWGTGLFVRPPEGGSCCGLWPLYAGVASGASATPSCA